MASKSTSGLDTASVWSTVGAFVASVASVAVGAWALIGSRTAAKEAEALVKQSVQQDSLEMKIERLAESMRDSAQLVEQVSADLNARAITAQKLKDEAANAKALAALNKDQADAVRRLLRSEMTDELASTGRRIFRDSVRIAIVFFIAGGIVSLLITLLVH
jgi:biopolymer transport protein ExbB/TolQ